jgi:PEGA domain
MSFRLERPPLLCETQRIFEEKIMIKPCMLLAIALAATPFTVHAQPAPVAAPAPVVDAAQQAADAAAKAAADAKMAADDAAAKAAAAVQGAAAAVGGAATAVVEPVVEAPKTGTLSVAAEPAGKLFIDGVDTGMVTPVADLPVPAGKHVIRVVSDAGGTAEQEVMVEAGGAAKVSVVLVAPPAPEVKPADVKPADIKPADAVAAAVSAPPADDWTWMTVAGWSAFGIGAAALSTGLIVLTTPPDPNKDTLGYGLFGIGAGLVSGGGVLLYLDAETRDAGAATPAPAAAPAK